MQVLLQARIRGYDGQSRHSALRHTARVCLRTSRLRVPVSRRVCTLSQRTFMNNAGYALLSIFPSHLSCNIGILSQIDINRDRVVPYPYCSVIRMDTRDNLK